MRYNFEWDLAKAKQNSRKHKVSFERATTVFRDPNQISIFDEDHSNDEDRWIRQPKQKLDNMRNLTHESRI